MSDVVATLRPRTDIAAAAARSRQADTRPEPTLLEQAGAAMRTAVDPVPVVQDARVEAAYQDVADALIELGVDPELTRGRRIGGDHGGMFQLREENPRQAIWDMARERGIAGLPATREEFERTAVRRGEGRSNDQDIMARGSGFDSWLAQTVGGMVGSLADPINFATTFASFGTGGVARLILTEVAINAGVESVLAFGQNPEAYARLGEEYTFEDGVRDVALAGATAGALRTGIELAPAAGRAAGRALRPITSRLPPMATRLAEFAQLRDAVARGEAPEGLSPEQDAALRFLNREDEIATASPFERTVEGDDLHRTRLDEASRDLAAGRRPQDYGPTDFGAVKRAIAGPESGGIDTATNRAGSSASGRYQFIEGTFRALYRRVYGASNGEAARAWQTQRFDVNVQERLMDQLLRENSAALRRGGFAPTTGNLYLAHFAGAEKAVRLLRAPDDAPVSRYFSQEAISQNATYLGGGKSVSEALAIIRGKVGDGAASTAAARPARPDPFADAADMASAEIDRLDGEAQLAEVARLDAKRLLAETTAALRPIVRDAGISLNRPEVLADELGIDPADLRRALTKMGLAGDIELAIRKSERGRVRATGGNQRWRWRTNEEVIAENGGIWPGTFRRARTPPSDDVLAFIARRGGISYDGLSERGRAAMGNIAEGKKFGHDMRNSGNFDTFVPGVGPLLRPGGMGIDDLGEQLWEAGYFGPSDLTPRPTEAEVMTWLDDIIRKGEKTYVLGEQAPERAPTREDIFGPDEDAISIEADALRDQWWSMYDRLGDVGSERFRLVLLNKDIADIAALMRQGTADLPPVDPRYVEDPEVITRYVAEYVNRKIDEALDNALLEADDAAYDFPSFDDARAEAGGAESSGAGRAPDAGSASDGIAGAGTGSDGSPARLSEAERDLADAAREGPAPDPEALRAFDDPAGDAIKAVADSHWHDIAARQQEDFAAPTPEQARIALERQAEGRMKGKVPQKPAGSDGGLFDANGGRGDTTIDMFDLGDGRGGRTIADIQNEIETDRAAIDAIRSCME